MAITECPVSYVTGESVALLEDFYVQRAVGGSAEIPEWPARRVDAFVTLKSELLKVERERNGQQ